MLGPESSWSLWEAWPRVYGFQLAYMSHLGLTEVTLIDGSQHYQPPTSTYKLGGVCGKRQSQAVYSEVLYCVSRNINALQRMNAKLSDLDDFFARWSIFDEFAKQKAENSMVRAIFWASFFRLFDLGFFVALSFPLLLDAGRGSSFLA